MHQVLQAVYEDGVLKPLGVLDLAEHQRVVVEVREPSEDDAEAKLAAWHQVYAGLSEQEIAEVEAIALDRSHFMREPS